MIVAGDVAIADGDTFRFEDFPQGIRTKSWLLNLEGAIAQESTVKPAWGTWNSSEWRQSFEGFSLGPVFVGNNHIHDIPNGILLTRDTLCKQGIQVFGAGEDDREASRAVLVKAGRQPYAFIGFGWPVIGCLPSGSDLQGVNRLEGNSARQLVGQALEDSREARVVAIIHGNYEFERYPQPAHRSLARQLIDLGAYAVIFHHPHVVGPVERYRGRTIVYSVGNWAFSFGRFFAGRLKFPQSSFHQVAVELGNDGDHVHHALFEPPTTVRYKSSERVDSDTLTLRAAFEGFDDDAYLDWFRRNRIKRRGLPIYTDPDDSSANRLKDMWVGLRQQIIDAGAKSGLKSMRRRSR